MDKGSGQVRGWSRVCAGERMIAQVLPGAPGPTPEADSGIMRRDDTGGF